MVFKFVFVGHQKISELIKLDLIFREKWDQCCSTFRRATFDYFFHCLPLTLSEGRFEGF